MAEDNCNGFGRHCGNSNAVHPDLSEDPAIFAEKLSLFPEGSFVWQMMTPCGDMPLFIREP